jgi:hypothetical protein
MAERTSDQIRAARATFRALRQASARTWSDADIDVLLDLVDRLSEGLEACLELLLADFYTAEEAKLWLRSPHSLLQGKTPEALIRAGEFRRVVELIGQLRDGVYT